MWPPHHAPKLNYALNSKQNGIYSDTNANYDIISNPLGLSSFPAAPIQGGNTDFLASASQKNIR
jgi:hypothetical protein